MNAFSEEELVEYFRKKISEEMGISKDEIRDDLEFINFGMDSVNAIFILQHIEKFIGAELNPLLFWDFPTIRSFSHHIITTYKQT